MLARKIESALEDVMEASRDLERFRDPVSELADALEAAEDKRLSIHTRARAVALELPAPPRLSTGNLQDRVDALAAVDIEPIMTLSVGGPRLGPGREQSGPQGRPAGA